MPILTLKGCTHPVLSPWGDETDDYSDLRTVTCMVCYERLLAPNTGYRTKVKTELLTPAPPALFGCPHTSKNPIPKDPKFKTSDYQDALCNDCGCVLRHPEGPGSWDEVIFNGYVIREEP
jgi:ribosomal protein S27E